MTTILTKTTRDGKGTVTIDLQAHPEIREVRLYASLDGKPIGDSGHVFRDPRLPEGYLGVVGKAALTPAEVAQVEAALAEAKAQLPMESDETVLRRQRQSLVLALSSAEESEQAERQAAHDDEGGDPGHYYRSPARQHQERIEAARQALTDFDSEHPEVLAQIQAEEEAALQRSIDRGD